jgi:3-deoxy-manno-octulosonate cytidylyltransferase (CMP-KDO synthetase)
MIDAATIDKLILDFAKSGKDIGTLIKKIDSNEELFNNAAVKVTISNQNEALYFSRNAIPFLRDLPESEWINNHIFWKHIGVYIYKYEAIKKFPSLVVSDLELSEKLEQLRFLQNGYKILCVETDRTFYGIDTQEDYNFVKNLFEK